MKKIKVGTIVLFIGLAAFLIGFFLNNYVMVASILIFIIGVFMLLGAKNLYTWAISIFLLGFFVIDTIPSMTDAIDCSVQTNGTNGFYSILPVYPPPICIAINLVSLLAIAASIVILLIAIIMSIVRRSKKN